MSKINIKELIRQLKEQEEQELTAIRQKRMVEEELLKNEAKKRNDEEKLNKLKIERENLDGQLAELNKKNFQLEIEALSWEKVAESKIAELRSAEEKLSQIHLKIWKQRDDFCADVDSFAYVCDALSKFGQNRMKQTKKSTISESESRENENEIQKLKAFIAEEEETEKSLNKKIEELNEEKKTLLLDAGSSTECARIKEWIQITRERCSELERRIAEKRKINNEQDSATAGQGDLPLSKTQLFSIVNLEDVKRVSQFNF